MEYNTTRRHLEMPEYGRNIQKMINYVVSIEDRQHRLRAAQVIVSIMAQMHPKVKETADYRQKLWDHLYIISDWRLDVDGPYPAPPKDVLVSKPSRIDYSSGSIRFKPYGKNIERIIEQAIALGDGPEKDALMKSIANHLKKSYLNWNRDSVNDELIFEHFRELTDGKTVLGEDFKLNETNDILAMNKKKKFPSKQRENNYPGGKNKKKYKQN